jgi:hypothetical protein
MILLRLFFKIFFIYKYIKIIFFKLFLILVHQNDLKILQNINFKSNYFKNIFKTQKQIKSNVKHTYQFNSLNYFILANTYLIMKLEVMHIIYFLTVIQDF